MRASDELWDAAQAVARARGESLSGDVLRPALERYVKEKPEPIGGRIMTNDYTALVARLRAESAPGDVVENRVNALMAADLIETLLLERDKLTAHIARRIVRDAGQRAGDDFVVATPHVCEDCETCGVHGNDHLKCCGCYDGACCQASTAP